MSVSKKKKNKKKIKKKTKHTHTHVKKTTTANTPKPVFNPMKASVSTRIRRMLTTVRAEVKGRRISACTTAAPINTLKKWKKKQKKNKKKTTSKNKWHF